MIVTVKEPTSSDAEWEVWLHIAEGDPLQQTESFAVGTGATRGEAVAAAMQALLDAITKMRGMLS